MTGKIREIVEFESHFSDFLKGLSPRVQDKVFKVMEAIATLERIPSNYLKAIKGSPGLYEARIQLGSDIWRVFCFFEEERLVILLNGFVKKKQKTPKREIEKAAALMKRYYTLKRK